MYFRIMDVRYSYCYMILVHLKYDRYRRILVMMAEKLPSEHEAFMSNGFAARLVHSSGAIIISGWLPLISDWNQARQSR
jgi:hypothetical protein